uniref:Tetratricopeptide repeat-containing protein n=1 Tax=Toxoplasma gondii COUG TaxID=1074873 RepID=A0A2G8XVA8_TOXGO|nr:tetratricopeptide repeat-containing protein [Toxoplasma gondii COUG]
MATDDVTLLDIDSEKIEKCTQPRLLRKYIALLEQDGGYYHQLLSAARKKLDDLVGTKTSSGSGTRWCRGPSTADIAAAKADILEWQRSLSGEQGIPHDIGARAVSIQRNTQTSIACGSQQCAVEATGIAVENGFTGQNEIRNVTASCNALEFPAHSDNSETDFKKTVVEVPCSDCAADGAFGEARKRVGSCKKLSSLISAHAGLPDRETDAEIPAGGNCAKESVQPHNIAGTAQYNHDPSKKRISVLLEDSDASDDSEHTEDCDLELIPLRHNSGEKPCVKSARRETSATPSNSPHNQPMQSQGEFSNKRTIANYRERTSLRSCCCFSEKESIKSNASQFSDDGDDTGKGTHKPMEHDKEPAAVRQSQGSHCGSPHDHSSNNSSQKILPAGKHSDSLCNMRTIEIHCIKGAAVAAYEEGNHEKALRLLSESLRIAEEDVLAAGERAYATPTSSSRNASLDACNQSTDGKLTKKLHSLLYSNRSQVHLTMGQYEEAAEDSLRAMQLDCTNIKALWRRARALLFLGGEDNLELASTVAKRIEDVFSQGEKYPPPSALDQLSDLKATIQSAIEQLRPKLPPAPHFSTQ